MTYTWYDLKVGDQVTWIGEYNRTNIGTIKYVDEYRVDFGTISISKDGATKNGYQILAVQREGMLTLQTTDPIIINRKWDDAIPQTPPENIILDTGGGGNVVTTKTSVSWLPLLIIGGLALFGSRLFRGGKK